MEQRTSSPAAAQASLSNDAFRRDPEFLRRIHPLLHANLRYHDTEVHGWSNLPRRGPFLVVGNHSGGAGTTDLAFFLDPWLHRRGARAPLYALAYDMLFMVPGLSSCLTRMGVVPASHDNARRALSLGAPVVVFPGGDYEVFRPWSERNRIVFGGHTGFIKLAIQTGVPVVPLTIHGNHASTISLTRGRNLARWMGLRNIHVNVFPFIWSIPFGPAPAFVPSIRIPSKVTVQVGRALDWSGYSPRQANNPKVVRRCYDEITGEMQATLDRLAARHPYPILERLGAVGTRH